MHILDSGVDGNCIEWRIMVIDIPRCRFNETKNGMKHVSQMKLGGY